MAIAADLLAPSPQIGVECADSRPAPAERCSKTGQGPGTVHGRPEFFKKSIQVGIAEELAGFSTGPINSPPTPGNLQLLCGACNSLKGDRDQAYLAAQLQQRGFLAADRL